MSQFSSSQVNESPHILPTPDSTSASARDQQSKLTLGPDNGTSHYENVSEKYRPGTLGVDYNKTQVHNVSRVFFPGSHRAENIIRGCTKNGVVGIGTGPVVPPHWLDAGQGWVTSYFHDLKPYDPETQQGGVHQCSFPGCDFKIEGGEGSSCGCWAPIGNAPDAMEDHLKVVHKIRPPRRQGKWGTELCEQEGWLEACLCGHCQAKQQIIAAHGYWDPPCSRMSPWGACRYGCSGDSGNNGSFLCCCAGPTVVSRILMVQLADVQESRCESCCIAWFCSVCSIAQVHRELVLAGGFSGGHCVVVPDANPML